MVTVEHSPTITIREIYFFKTGCISTGNYRIIPKYMLVIFSIIEIVS